MPKLCSGGFNAQLPTILGEEDCVINHTTVWLALDNTDLDTLHLARKCQVFEDLLTLTIKIIEYT